MARARSILAAGVTAFALLAPGAAAAPVLVAPPGSGANWGVRIAAGDDGRALITWTRQTSRFARAVVAERTATGRIVAPVDVLAGRPLYDTPFAFPSRAGDDVLARAWTPDYSSADLLGLHRERGAETFGAPLTIEHARGFRVFQAAANARGDRAVLVRGTSGSTMLRTARAGSAFGSPQPLGDVKPRGEPAVAIGPTGRIVVVYGSDLRAVVRRGLLGGPLGPPQVLERLRSWPTFGAAIDDRGVATVAFSRFTPSRRGVRTTTSAVVARAATGSPFGPPLVLARETNGVDPELAAAGATTVAVWSRAYPASGLQVAVARGTAGFGAVRPVGPQSRTRRADTPYSPSLAVDAAGDILLAYEFGTASTHAALWIAGAPGFEAPRVISALGHGGSPAAALLPDRTPLVAFSDGDAVHLGDPGSGTPVSLTPPRAEMTRADPLELQRDLRASTRVVCRQACWMSAYGRITTGPGPSGKPRQVRSGHRFPGQLLRADEPTDLVFDAKPAARAALDASGHAKAIITVIVSNASGASRTIRETIEFGCRSVTARCPRPPI